MNPKKNPRGIPWGFFLELKIKIIFWQRQQQRLQLA